MHRSLFVCSLYKSALLQGTPRNDPHPIMRAWDEFLRDRRATSCPVREDRQAFFFYPGVLDAILLPRVPTLRRFPMPRNAPGH